MDHLVNDKNRECDTQWYVQTPLSYKENVIRYNYVSKDKRPPMRFKKKKKQDIYVFYIRDKTIEKSQ